MTEEICECGHKKEHHHSLIKFKDNKGECSKCECKKFTLKNEGNHSLISDINEGLRTLSKELLPAEKNHSPEKLRKLQILGASINVPKKKIKKRKYLSTLKMYQKKKLKREDTSNSKETLSDKIVPQRCCKCGLLDLQILYVKDVKKSIKKLKEKIYLSYPNPEVQLLYEMIDKIFGDKLTK